MLTFLLCDPGWCAHTLYTERCRVAFRIDGMTTHTYTHIRHKKLCSRARPFNCVLSVRIHDTYFTSRREQMGLLVVQKVWTPREAHTKKEQG